MALEVMSATTSSSTSSFGCIDNFPKPPSSIHTRPSKSSISNSTNNLLPPSSSYPPAAADVPLRPPGPSAECSKGPLSAVHPTVPAGPLAAVHGHSPPKSSCKCARPPDRHAPACNQHGRGRKREGAVEVEVLGQR